MTDPVSSVQAQLTQLWEQWRNLGRITPDNSSVVLTRAQVWGVLSDPPVVPGLRERIEQLPRYQVWGDNSNTRAVDPDGSYMLVADVLALATLPAEKETDITGLRKPEFKQPNWDSYGGAPITDVAIDAAETLWRRFAFVPCSDGGVQLEVHTHGYDIEIAFDPEGRPVGWSVESAEKETEG